MYISGIYASGGSFAVANEARMTDFYGGLELFFQEHRSLLEEQRRRGADETR